MGSLRQFASIVEKMSSRYSRFPGSIPEPHRDAGPDREIKAPASDDAGPD